MLKEKSTSSTQLRMSYKSLFGPKVSLPSEISPEMSEMIETRRMFSIDSDLNSIRELAVMLSLYGDLVLSLWYQLQSKKWIPRLKMLLKNIKTKRLYLRKLIKKEVESLSKRII